MIEFTVQPGRRSAAIVRCHCDIGRKHGTVQRLRPSALGRYDKRDKNHGTSIQIAARHWDRVYGRSSKNRTPYRRQSYDGTRYKLLGYDQDAQMQLARLVHLGSLTIDTYTLAPRRELTGQLRQLA
jgi:hypothetical protein